MRRAIACAIAVIGLAACGGDGREDAAVTQPDAPAGAATTEQEDDPTAAEYVALLERSYTRVHDRFVETIGPCLAGELRECDRRAAPVRKAAKALLVELEGADVPADVEAEHAQLQNGVAALDAAIEKQHKAIAAENEKAFNDSISAVEQAIAEIDAAAHGINSRYRENLPTVH